MNVTDAAAGVRGNWLVESTAAYVKPSAPLAPPPGVYVTVSPVTVEPTASVVEPSRSTPFAGSVTMRNRRAPGLPNACDRRAIDDAAAPGRVPALTGSAR